MIRRRRKRPIDSGNHERWLVSYADFVTLLFAFFVVMYSISAVHEEKYKAFSTSLGEAFFEQSRDITENKPMEVTNPPASIQTPSSANPVSEQAATGFDLAKEREQMRFASEQLTLSLKSLINENMVSIKNHDYWIELELSSGILFFSGNAELSASSIPVIKKIAEVFKPLPNAINVEGHTDNNPINTLKFPSNWELSSARATRVVQEFVKEGVDPKRLSATGYGQHHPIAENTKEEGRFKNRRVVILLISNGFNRYGANEQDRAGVIEQMPVAILAGLPKQSGSPDWK